MVLCRYGGLDLRNPMTFSPSWMSAGFNWSLGGFLLNNVLKRVGPQRTLELRERVAGEIGTTFATHFTEEVSLAEALDPAHMRRFAAQATGEKFLLNPSK